jgi:PadR family transcriptional regulator PadR
MNQRSNFKKGSVEMLLLHILSCGDCYGYQLTQLIREHSKEIIVIPEGSMYPTLYKLLENQYISDYKKQVGRRLTRVYYHLEEKGQQHLEDLVKDYHDVNAGIMKVLDYKVSS